MAAKVVVVFVVFLVVVLVVLAVVAANIELNGVRSSVMKDTTKLST